jgi:hypothetical protein
MNKSRQLKMGRHVASIGKKMNACRIWVGKPGGRRRLRRPRHRWEDNIRIYFEETEWGNIDRIHLAQNKDL